jgi:outer membrane protein assembly factor BamB
MKSLPALLALLTLPVHAATDWPRFLGPEGNATVTTADVPLAWSDTENLRWRAPIPGPGTSSPIVWKDKIYLTCWTGYGTPDGGDDITKLTRHLLCYALADGKLLWQADVPAEQPEDPYQGFITEHGYATHTPVTDGKDIYVFFGKSGALAFSMEGKKLWQTNLGKSSSSKRWGSAASPILYDGKVIVNASDEGRALVALDQTSGSILWKAEGDNLDSAYGTPAIIKHGDSEDLVLAVPQELWGLNPDTGKLRWYASHRLPGNVSPTVIHGGDKLFVFGGYPTTGSAAYKLGGTGDLTESNRLWSTTTSSYVPTPVLHKDHLYVINDQGFAICLNAKTGEDVYRERAIQDGPRGRGKPFYASPVLIGDRLYCVSRKSGTFVIAAHPEFKELARNVFANDDSQFNATPAVTGNTLILRSDKYLYAIGTP